RPENGIVAGSRRKRIRRAARQWLRYDIFDEPSRPERAARCCAASKWLARSRCCRKRQSSPPDFLSAMLLDDAVYFSQICFRRFASRAALGKGSLEFLHCLALLLIAPLPKRLLDHLTGAAVLTRSDLFGD